MKGGGTTPRRPAAFLGAAALLVSAYPALAKLLTLLFSDRRAAFVDQRYQVVSGSGAAAPLGGAVAAAMLAALFWGGWEALRRRGDAERRPPEYGLFFAAMPLVLLAPWRFLPLTYAAIPFCMICFAWAAGRFASQLRGGAAGSGFDRYGRVLLAAFVVGYALWGWLSQLHSFAVLGMQWLDWGHYYESLRNTFQGRFFYLNLSHGCFLGSRFCPSLIVLAPVLAFGVSGFFFAGALLVASGALLVYALARHYRATAGEALFFGVWYLLLPGTVNLELPLLDGFHEVFLLFPAVLGALLAYEKHRYVLAGALVLFCFGVRETTPFMFLGFGVTLMLTGRRRDGAILAGASLLALVLILGVLMPLARPEEKTVYDHVTFYPHLGNTVREIALSPVLRFKAFWGRLFCDAHSWRYYLALFPPFLFFAAAAPEWLIPMIFDLVMVVEDRRFDSQTLLRHYQCVMLITMVAAVLAGFRRMRFGQTPRYVRWLLYPVAERPVRGMMAATMTATLGMTLFFTQIPGLPASDPRLDEWRDVRETVRSFTAAMEPGSQVTAGPRLAGFLVDDYDVYLSSDAAEPLKRYVLIEGLNPDYRQKKLRAALLGSPEWTLAKWVYLPDRLMLIQLFERRRRTAPLRGHGIARMTEREWAECGSPIPCGLREIEARGRFRDTPAGRLMIVSVRLREAVDFDIGFTPRISYFDSPDTASFVSFGNGMLPAELAPPGAVFTFAVPVAGRMKSFRLDCSRCGDAGQEL